MTTIEERLGNMEDIIQRLMRIEEQHGNILERQQVILEAHEQRMAELRRDAAKTQRLWVRLCKKYGWLDDEDLLAED